MKKKIFSILFALMLVVSLSLVTAVPVAAADITVGSSGEDHTTIQAAIDAALAGDTIIVSDGTYTEDLTVNIANLTIKSVTGSANTTIQLVDSVGIDIQGGASGFTLGGASGEGFNILSGASTTFSIQLANAPSGVEISHNTIDSTVNAGYIVLNVGAAGAIGLTVSDNSFTAETGDGSIWGPNVVDVTVSNNILNGGAYAVQFSGVTGVSFISENTISGYTGSGGIVISNGAGTSGLTISDNNISSCGNGIFFVEYCAQGTAADMTTVTISGNTITNSTNDAIKVGDGTHVLASNFVIVNNKISGSTSYGLENQHATEQVAAEKNWWGDATGPDHSSNPHGTGQGGDAVTDDVDFTPWYATATTTPSTENVSVEHNPIIAVSDTIQGGIDAALAGDTVTVSDGTYTEDVDVLDVGVTGITIQGESLSAIVEGGFLIRVDDITIDGFTIKNGRTGATAEIAAIVVEGESDGHTFTNNTLIGLNLHNTYGINLSKLSDSVLIDGNVSYNWEFGIYLRSQCSNITVSNNEVYDNLKIGIAVSYSTGCLVTNNDVHGNNTLALAFGNGGIVVYRGSGNIVSSNQVYNNLIAGLDLGETTNCVVTNNDIHDNNTPGSVDGAGIVVYKGTGHLVNYNDIYDNGNNGLLVVPVSPPTVDALYNWWGDISGPYHATTNPGGLGDEVSDDVDYQPWLTRVFQTVLDDNIAYFGEAIVNLDNGWNIFSTPIALDPACDTWGEYIALGDGLSIHSTSPAYAFDGASQSWVPITSTYRLNPCEAIYIRMAEADIAAILYSPNTSVPSTPLYSEWNLVGLASLVDMLVGDALVSVYNVIGDLSGYSLAVSPAIGNQTVWIFIRGVGSQDSMQVTKGYWVFMINPGTLAGFTFTPMSLP